MRDVFIVYSDGRRIAVSNLPLSEIQRLDAIAPHMANTGNSDRTQDQLRARLQIELLIRSRRMNCLI